QKRGDAGCVSAPHAAAGNLPGFAARYPYRTPGRHGARLGAGDRRRDGRREVRPRLRALEFVLLLAHAHHRRRDGDHRGPRLRVRPVDPTGVPSAARLAQGDRSMTAPTSSTTAPVVEIDSVTVRYGTG